jgi:hypothetical protein
MVDIDSSQVSSFTETGSLQTATVAESGEYQITLYGAAGGSGLNNAGGAGAEVVVDIDLTAGTVLDIVVGEEGASTQPQGGGGGASAVYIPGEAPVAIAVAGGGGGGSYYGSGGPGLASDPNGEAPGSGDAFGGGGGSFNSAGGSENQTYPNIEGGGGGALDDGAAGGVGADGLGAGGYGGGGGGGEDSGGGGGGYGGGDGAYLAGGGGGSSYVETDPSIISSSETQGVETGDGEVSFTFLAPLCFMRGVRIRTPNGETPVEALRPGDLVSLADGTTQPVWWLGRQTIAIPTPDAVGIVPIRIKKGALGRGLPTRDLLVSPGHALFFDGLLIEAGALVNGVSIVREEPRPEPFTYFHIELDHHALVLAEGAPAESYLDIVDRTVFDNHAERAGFIGETSPATEMPYPRITARRQIPGRTLQKLGGASAERGQTPSAAYPSGAAHARRWPTHQRRDEVRSGTGLGG